MKTIKRQLVREMKNLTTNHTNQHEQKKDSGQQVRGGSPYQILYLHSLTLFLKFMMLYRAAFVFRILRGAWRVSCLRVR